MLASLLRGAATNVPNDEVPDIVPNDEVPDLPTYVQSALAELARTDDEGALEAWYRRHLAPSGALNLRKRSIGKLPPEHRREAGQGIHRAEEQIGAAFRSRKEEIRLLALRERLWAASVDVTLPPRALLRGGYHPSTQLLREVGRIFALLGFVPFESPHVELDEHNFGLLNMPPDHPARDMQDTFYITDDVLLRTHTSSGQVRAMRRAAPHPVRIILPGLCYRREDITARSEIQFHQVEGLLIGPGVRMSDLKGILLFFARHIFGESQEIRLRGSYFPFTEPSVEIDIRCTLCGGAGCRVCKHTGWLELLGAGLVHPTVLRNGGYDPARVRGVAFGMGIERMLLLRHGIHDIRLVFENDIRFLQQFA